MTNREFKNRAYQLIATVAQGFSNAGRMEIISLLAQAPKSVEMIARETGLSVANASQHLQKLKAQRLVKTDRQGNRIFYALQSAEVYRAFRALQLLSQNLKPELDGLIGEFRSGHGISPGQSLERLPDGEDFLLLDVRPEEEYDERHIPGALCIPIDQLNDRLGELPTDKLIIAYCRGTLCSYADEAVEALRSRGYDATRLEANALDIHLKTA